MKSIGIFCDISNLYYSIKERFNDRKLDYHKFKTISTGEDILYKACAYGLQRKDEATRFIAYLKHFGFETKYKVTKGRVSWNVGMSMDIVRIVLSNKLDTIVFGTSDTELIPVIELCKDYGILTHVFACGIPEELKAIADKCTEIDETMLNEI